jgi:hypothetical protein
MKLEAKDYLNKLDKQDLEMLTWILIQVKLNPKSSIHRYVKNAEGDLDRLDRVKTKLQCAVSVMLRDEATEITEEG